MPEYTFIGPQNWEFEGDKLSPGDSVEASEAFAASFPQFFEEADADAEASPGPAEVVETDVDADTNDDSGADADEETETESPFDPSDATVTELEDRLDDESFSDDELDALADAEREGKDRETALDAIDEAR